MGKQTGSINVGTILFEISWTTWALPVLFGLLVFVWLRRRKAIKTVDMLIKATDDYMEDNNGDEKYAIKEQYRSIALSRGLEKFLRKRIKKVRKSRR